MRLKDLCNEFWDEIIALMDYQVIEKITQPIGGLSRIEAVRAYCMEDPEFFNILRTFLHLDEAEIAREMSMQRKAS